jgi:exodeoxyribonuclease V alpha subunit
MLWQNHRFGRQPGIGAFATALMRRDAAAAGRALFAGHDDLVHEPDAQLALVTVFDPLLAQRDAAAAGDADAALAALAHARILTAQRRGPTGAVAWNRLVERELEARGHRVDHPYYIGRPVLVTENDHQSRIWNGDLGVAGRNDRGRVVVWFKDGNGRVRELNPRRLPAHETAWAMTVHKAQGSEFDDVLLAMPDRDGPLWNASLLYTGVTRARRRAVVVADPALLAASLANWPERSSGLADALSR